MTDITQLDRRSIATLQAVMAALREPETGCPWDLQQDFTSIAPYTIEEAYEVADAIERGCMADLCDELGDLLLQVVYHAQMAEEQQAFSLDDVINAICEKMIRRHPHVFGSAEERQQPPEKGFWERLKAHERQAKAPQDRPHLSSVPVNLPALTRAAKLQKKAAAVGFDWPEAASVLDKVVEEANELQEATAAATPAAIEEEFGDLLFALTNLARHLEVDPEMALRRANAKFTRRFAFIENSLKAAGRSLEKSSLGEMDALWNEAKTKE